ncbi:MAG: type III-A CRISPR-associated protein Cas10/Csm1 [Planctomycetaceae bacterium]
MIVSGDISGIQTFITDVRHTGGGQARRLRSRSFYVQMLCEAAAVEVLTTLDWPINSDSIVMSAAGHFVLQGESSQPDAILQQLERRLNQWLIDEMQGDIRLALGWSRAADTMDAFREAAMAVDIARSRPLASALCGGGRWDSAAMLLPPLDTPCPICGQRKADVEETDPESQSVRVVCVRCHSLHRLGAQLTDVGRAWLVMNRAEDDRTGWSPTHESVPAFSLRVSLSSRFPNPNTAVAVSNIDDPKIGINGPFAAKWLSRPLARYVPENPDGSTLSFREMAQRAGRESGWRGKRCGDAKLGVLKADGDGMGDFWSTVLANAGDLAQYSACSRAFDQFAANQLNNVLACASRESDEMRQGYQHIYTVFSGGDDLLFVGPWNTILDFAGELQQMFRQHVSQLGGSDSPALTISAGVALVKPGWPIRRTVEAAEDLLEFAKQRPANGHGVSRDQIATLGSVWKWAEHATVIDAGKRWAGWVSDGKLDRGLLHTIREMNEAQRGHRNVANDATGRSNERLAAARLDYIVTRRVSKPWKEFDTEMEILRKQFENPVRADIVHLSSVLQYAILATKPTPADNES